MVKQSILKIDSFTTLNNTLLVLLFLSIKGGDRVTQSLFGHDRPVVSKAQVGKLYEFILMDEQTIYFRQNILPSVLSELS